MVSSSGIGGQNRYIQQAQQGVATSAQRIASGLRINSAADDAAGLAISNRLTANTTAFSQSIRNASDGISLAQTASGSLSNVTDNIQRLRELSIQSANGILNDSDRKAIAAEANQLGAEIARVIENSSFNNVPLLSNSGGISIQVGGESDDNINIQTADLQQKLSDLGFANLNLGSAEGAQNALGVLDELQGSVDSAAIEFGASINRFESTINTLSNSRVNAEASRSRIQDADIARESSELARFQVMKDVAIALQVQANNNNASVLNLLG